MIKSFSRSARRAGSISLDGGVALLAASSVAFLAFAMPTDLFSRLVTDSGLPSLIAAAEPPLGMKARLAAVAAGAFITFAAVWVLLRALDRAAAAPRRYDAVNLSAEAPKLRRADLHPDAPPRRPLFASQDFGEPSDDKAEEEEYFPAAADEPLELDSPISDPQPESAFEPAPAFDTPLRDAPQTEPEIEGEPEMFAGPTAEPAPRPDALASLAAPLPDAADESVANLMQRLEGGLVRREGGQNADHAPGAPAPGQPAGHRLRSALNDLERMAKRG